MHFSRQPGLRLFALGFLVGWIGIACGDDDDDDDSDTVTEQPPEDVSYADDVFPVFRNECLICHGTAGGLDMTTYDALMQGGQSGPVIVSGDASGSLLVKRIEGTIEPKMPAGGSLDKDEISQIRSWIDEGAEEN